MFFIIFFEPLVWMIPNLNLDYDLKSATAIRVYGVYCLELKTAINFFQPNGTF